MSSRAAESFAGSCCWDPRDLTKILDYDAGRAADSVLLAVHSPATVTIGIDGKMASEQEALERLTTIDEHGIKIVPILGKAGSGKSHLVRWFRPHVNRIDNAFVVYIRRGGASLRGLINGILDSLEKIGETDGSRDLRAQLERAFDQIETDGIEGAILNRIDEQLEVIARGETADRKRAGLAAILPALIRDESFRRPLQGTGGVVDRYVASVMQDDQVDLEGRGFSFGTSDIPTMVQLDGRLGDHAQSAWDQLDSDPEFRELAAELISEAFTKSIPQLFGLAGQTSLEAVFRSARKLLLEKGQSLYVLIEDLSRMQGFERALLESFLELPSVEGGPRELCDLHVAIAVTTGFYQDYTSETFRERVRAMNNRDGGELIYLESITDSAGWSPQTLTSFASRYLNALRVGPIVLEEAYSEATLGSEAAVDWVPTACNECPHLDNCHSSFGDTDGQGHYPFNGQALSAFYEDVVGRTETLEGQFNPRNFIQYVLEPILRNSPDQLRSGGFPPPDLDETYKNAPSLKGGVIAGIETNQGDEDRQRRKTLLRFWGGSPETVIDMPLGIHEAFRIDPTGTDRPTAITGSSTVRGSSVALQWLLPTEVQDGIDLRVSADNGVNWESRLTGSTETSFEDSNLTEGATYNYEVSPSGSNASSVRPWQTRVTVRQESSRTDPLVRAVEQWVGQQQIGRAHTTKFLDALHSAVLGAVDWHGLGLPRPPSQGSHLIGRRAPEVVLNKFSFHVEDSIGVNKDQTKVVRELKRDQHGGLLINLSRAMTSEGQSGAIGLGPDGYTSLTRYIDDVADEVMEEIQVITESDDDDSLTRALAERLSLGGLLGGIAESELDHVSLAEAVFADVSGVSPDGAGHWARLVSELLHSRSTNQETFADLARTTQTEHRDGSTLRTGRIARLLRPISASWTPVTGPLEGPPKLDRLSKRDLNSAVKERLEQLSAATVSLDELLGGESLSWEELVEKIKEAMNDSIRAACDESFDEVNSMLEMIRQQPSIVEYQGLGNSSQDDDLTIGDKLLATGVIERLRPVEVQRALHNVSTTLNRVVANAHQKLPPEPSEDDEERLSPVEAVESTVRALLTKLDEL